MKRDDIYSIIGVSLRSIASSIPVAASIANAWSEVEGKIRDRRINEYFDTLRLKLNQLEKEIEKVQNLLEPEEVAELIEKTISKILITTSEYKRTLFANIFVNSLIQWKNISHDTKISIIESLDLLTNQDLQILRHFKSGHIIRTDRLLNAFPELSGTKEERLSLLIVSLTKLESRGIVGETNMPSSDVYAGAGLPDRWTNRWLNKYYEILPFGDNFKNITEISD
jgi:hypothetical protein